MKKVVRRIYPPMLRMLGLVDKLSTLVPLELEAVLGLDAVIIEAYSTVILYI
jgi:hypothetical protein